MEQKQIDRINELARKAMTPEGLTQAIDQAVKKINPDYYTVINVDRDYAEA